MPVLPYCVFSNELTFAEIVTGVQQAPVLRIEEGELACLYSEVEKISTDTGELAQAAMAFQSVVQQVFGAGVVIPFRFPTLLTDLDELGDHLRERESIYDEALFRLEGTAQMEIKFSKLALGGAPAPATSGKEYLKSRKSDADALEKAIDEVKDAAAEIIIQWRKRQKGDVTRCYALIVHARAAEFKKAVGFVKPGAGIRAAVSGPWPPSDFIVDDQH